MNDYMTKPFEPSRLIALLARLTGRTGAERAG